MVPVGSVDVPPESQDRYSWPAFLEWRQKHRSPLQALSVAPRFDWFVLVALTLDSPSFLKQLATWLRADAREFLPIAPGGGEWRSALIDLGSGVEPTEVLSRLTDGPHPVSPLEWTPDIRLRTAFSNVVRGICVLQAHGVTLGGLPWYWAAALIGLVDCSAGVRRGTSEHCVEAAPTARERHLANVALGHRYAERVQRWSS